LTKGERKRENNKKKKEKISQIQDELATREKEKGEK
jgi:hypothetical protein